ncbi:hypothetical protein CVT24_009818 [Panaeolus cyanescens]|uniref:Tyr recombinase domain-containing protein n=1 Tax=Panaeolus cyanescens TaxID=181874 RepID=A0A409X159_9AGAR|nr:hypothetical protein CVT24_009818 [Panaeolus cyanescens]
MTGSHLSTEEADRIYNVLSASWLPSTKQTYGAGLLMFHVFCDSKNPPSLCRNLFWLCGEELRLWSGAWHTLHALPWEIPDDKLSAALSGAEKLAPATARRPPRAPVTVAYVEALFPFFDMSNSLDVAVFACLTTVFWSVSRLGEFTVPRVAAFDPLVHVKVSDVVAGETVGALGLPVTSFRIPRTKTAPQGETVQWSPQVGNADPKRALDAHLALNKPGPGDHLFAWRASPTSPPHPLSRHSFLRRVNVAASHASLARLQGHSLRIGGVLVYLLRGIPFDVVKTLGRWSSDSFSLYLRQHADILAPYIQGSPVLEPFTRITMPSRTR